MDNNQLSFEAAKTIYNSSNNKEVLEALETVFPQLRENEDEKIREEIISIVKSYRESCITEGNHRFDDCIAWLEKQGEKLPVGFYYVNSEGKKFYSDTFKYGDLTLHVEKQDEQKPDNKPELKFAVNDWVVNKYGDIWHIDSLDKKNYRVSNKGRYNYFPIAKQDEMHLWTIEDAKPGDLLFISTKQRNYWAMFKEYDDNNKFIFFYCYICGDFNIGGFVPIDCINKINPLPFSPHSGRFYNTMKKAGYEWDDLNNKLVNINPDLQKFYTGDWVICTDQGGYEHIRQITNVEIFTPAFDSKQCHRYWTSDLTWFGDSYDARLWTLDDAKDGDVLVDDDNNIFIFDGTVEEGKYPFAYCGLTAQGFDSYDIRLPFTHNNNIHPATWEQRNLLFKKMKEAGYEWDDEKKELKKIDTYCQNNCKGFQETGKCFADGDCEAKKNVQIINKDDALLESAIAFIESSDKFCEWKGNSKKDVLDWIDSLKHRVQQKQEWTEEDIRNIENIDSVLFYDKDLPEDTCMRLRNWLQSLKPNKDMIEALRTEYEKGRADVINEIKSSWSEKDENTIKVLRNIIRKSEMIDSIIYTDSLKEKLYNWLESIRLQKQWKPSNEHIEALENFVRSYGESGTLSPYDNNTKLLYSLLFDLKNLNN